MILKVKKLDPRAKLPTYATEGSAGLDLYALENVALDYGAVSAIRTGIAVEIPPGYEGQTRGRSGLAFNDSVFAPHVGTIDSDYRGEITVLLRPQGLDNGMKQTSDGRRTPVGFGRVKIKAGERIAQLIIAPVARVEVVETPFLSPTARGSFGFGSTGR